MRHAHSWLVPMWRRNWGGCPLESKMDPDERPRRAFICQPSIFSHAANTLVSRCTYSPKAFKRPVCTIPSSFTPSNRCSQAICYPTRFGLFQDDTSTGEKSSLPPQLHPQTWVSPYLSSLDGLAHSHSYWRPRATKLCEAFATRRQCSTNRSYHLRPKERVGVT